MTERVHEALRGLREAMTAVEHALIEVELEIEDSAGTGEAAVLGEREEEIDRLRRECIGLRETIKAQSAQLARLRRRGE